MEPEIYCKARRSFPASELLSPHPFNALFLKMRLREILEFLCASSFKLGLYLICFFRSVRSRSVLDFIRRTFQPSTAANPSAGSDVFSSRSSLLGSIAVVCLETMKHCSGGYKTIRKHCSGGYKLSRPRVYGASSLWARPMTSVAAFGPLRYPTWPISVFGPTLPSLGPRLNRLNRLVPAASPTTPPISPTATPHRFSLMARVSLGPSDVPFPVRSSTAHDDSQSWFVFFRGAPSSIINSDMQDGGGDDLNPFPSTATSVRSRSALLNDMPSLFLEICYLIKDGRGIHSILVTIFLDESCFYKSRNLTDKAALLSPDANSFLKLVGLVLLSIFGWCDADHATAILGEEISSTNRINIKLNLSAPSLMGDASQQSRTLWNKSLGYGLSILLSRFFKPDYLCLDLNGRGLHSSMATSSVFLSCEPFWRTQPTYSFKEIPFLKPYSNIGIQPPPLASSMEQFTKSSYASYARAVYDHKLIGNFLKLVFNLEFLSVSKDSPTFANFLKLSLLENSLNPYLYFSCIVLLSTCMNLPPLRI